MITCQPVWPSKTATPQNCTATTQPAAVAEQTHPRQITTGQARELMASASICFRSDLPDNARWIPAAAMIENPDLWISHLENQASSYQMPLSHPVAALVFQRYCHKVAGVAAGIWLASGKTINPAAGNCLVGFACSPNETSQPQCCDSICTPAPDGELVALQHLTSVVVSDPVEFMYELIENHLYPIALTTHKYAKSSLANLRGNIAASIALGAEYASRWQPVEVVYQRLRPLLDARPELDKLGDYVTYNGPKGPRVRYERKSCCHWYEVVKPTPKRYCCWCSKATPDERARMIAESVAAEAAE